MTDKLYIIFESFFCFHADQAFEEVLSDLIKYDIENSLHTLNEGKGKITSVTETGTIFSI